jgi:hypothetical protein
MADVRSEHEVKLTDFKKWLSRPGHSRHDVTQLQRIRSILSTEVSRQDCSAERTEVLVMIDKQGLMLIPRNLAFTLRTCSGPMSLRRDAKPSATRAT